MQAEKNLMMRVKKTMLVNFDESSDEDVNMSQQQKKLIQANANFDKELLLEREREFQRIESDVIDINQIMSEISTLISGENNFLISISIFIIIQLFFQNKEKESNLLIMRFLKSRRTSKGECLNFKKPRHTNKNSDEKS